MWGPPGIGKTDAVDNVMRKFLKEVQGTGGRHAPLRVSTNVSSQHMPHVVPAEMYLLIGPTRLEKYQMI
jgi:hypothetical protein